MKQIDNNSGIDKSKMYLLYIKSKKSKELVFLQIDNGKSKIFCRTLGSRDLFNNISVYSDTQGVYQKQLFKTISWFGDLFELNDCEINFLAIERL